MSQRRKAKKTPPPPKPHKDATLEAMVEHVVYEIEQLQEMALLLKANLYPPAVGRRKTASLDRPASKRH